MFLSTDADSNLQLNSFSTASTASFALLLQVLFVVGSLVILTESADENVVPANVTVVNVHVVIELFAIT
jgi:hypothetical protein